MIREPRPPEREQLGRLIAEECGPVKSVRLISDVNNEVYHVALEHGECVLKVYTMRGVHSDLEAFVRSVVGEAHFFRRMHRYDASRTRYPAPYAIFEYIRGKTVLERVKEGGLDAQEIDTLCDQLQEFIELMTSHRIAGCGFLNEEGGTSHSNWQAFLLDYQRPTVESLMGRWAESRLCKTAYEVICDRWDLLAVSDFRLVPIDLNLGNLLIAESGRFVTLDPGGVAAGDWLFGLGEFVGHTYTTPLCEPLLQRFYLTNEERRRVHLYALLMNLNVLGFIARQGLGDVDSAKPWGNATTFRELIELHYARILGEQF